MTNKNPQLTAATCDAYIQNCDSKKMYASDILLKECSEVIKTMMIEIMILKQNIEYLEDVASVELAALSRRKKCQQPIYKPYKPKK